MVPRLPATHWDGGNGDGYRSRPRIKDRPGGKERQHVAIYRLLQQAAFGPEEIDRLVTAFEDSLRALKLQDRTDPLTETIAKKLIEIAQTGERDPRRLRRRALEALDLPAAD